MQREWEGAESKERPPAFISLSILNSLLCTDRAYWIPAAQQTAISRIIALFVKDTKRIAIRDKCAPLSRLYLSISSWNLGFKMEVLVGNGPVAFNQVRLYTVPFQILLKL